MGMIISPPPPHEQHCTHDSMCLVLQYKMVDTFCYWDAKSKTDLIIIIVNQTVVTVLLSVAALRMPTLIRLCRGDLSIDVAKITLIHAMIIAWAIIQSGINYYSIGVFLQLGEEVANGDMIGHSSRYALLSAFPGYIVQTLFVTICYTLNLVRETDIRKFPNYCLKFVLALKVYYFYRLVVWLVAVVLVGAASPSNIAAASSAEFLSLIVDSVVINSFIFLSLRIFINRLSQDFLALKREYQLMFFFSMCRVVLDSLYLTLPHTDEGYCVSEQHYRVQYTLLYNVAGNYFLHFLPIAVTLKIYYFDYREVIDREQLIPRFSTPATI